jgi:hypothetical protein
MAECILKNNDITKFDIIPVGGAIFPTMSFFNHSCYPNSLRLGYQVELFTCDFTLLWSDIDYLSLLVFLPLCLSVLLSVSLLQTLVVFSLTL